MAKSTAKFLYENIWCRFGCPIELVSDRGKHFVNNVIASLTQHYVVVHKRSTPYYPQANGLAKSTNKTLKGILRKTVNAHRTDWDRKLQSTLWTYRTSFKTNIGATPFRLAFGLEAIMPIEFEIPSLHIKIQERLHEHASQLIGAQKLLALDEQRVDNERCVECDQLRRKTFVERYSRHDQITLREGSPVLVFSSRSGLMPRKLKLWWSGPFLIMK